MTKKKLFKFGAALTAALMVSSSFGVLAFADEVDETPALDEPAVVDVIDEVPADETPAEEVPVVVETPEATEAPAVVETPDEDVVEDAPVQLMTDKAVEIESAVSSVKKDESVVSVTVTYSGLDTGDQMTVFVYDVASIGTPGDDTPYGTSVTTPVKYINQETKTGTITFGVKIVDQNGDPIKIEDEDDVAALPPLVVKIGGTDAAPAGKLVLLSSSELIDVTYGDVNGDTNIDMDDAIVIYEIYCERKTDATPLELKAADVDASGEVDMDDAILIYEFYCERIKSFPADNQ